MPIILPLGLTSEEIRVLQEFRRLNADSLPPEKIKAVKHPPGIPAAKTGEAPAVSLVDKGWLEVDGSRENFTLTGKAKDFLAVDAKPEFEEAGSAPAAAAESVEADAG